jgi:hypothetical protein
VDRETPRRSQATATVPQVLDPLEGRVKQLSSMMEGCGQGRLDARPPLYKK